MSGGPHGPKEAGNSFILDFYCQHLRRLLFVFCLGALTGPGEFCQILRLYYVKVNMFEKIKFFPLYGGKLVPVPNWYRCQIDPFYTLGAKLVRCQIGTGAKLTPLHSWCQIGTGAKLTLLHSWCQIDLLTLLVPNWLRCQIGTGAKLSSNRFGGWVLVNDPDEQFVTRPKTATGHFALLSLAFWLHRGSPSLRLAISQIFIKEKSSKMQYICPFAS